MRSQLLDTIMYRYDTYDILHVQKLLMLFCVVFFYFQENSSPNFPALQFSCLRRNFTQKNEKKCILSLPVSRALQKMSPYTKCPFHVFRALGPI